MKAAAPLALGPQGSGRALRCPGAKAPRGASLGKSRGLLGKPALKGDIIYIYICIDR